MNEYKYKQGFCALIRRTKRIKYTEFRAHIIANVRERTCAATIRIYFYFVRFYFFFFVFIDRIFENTKKY